MNHIRELSSIRGIAAVVVLFGHVLSVFTYQSAVQPPFFESVLRQVCIALKYIFNGSASVEIFFVLSGLVLSLSLAKRDVSVSKKVAAFYVKRIFRIYPALWVSLILVIACLGILVRGCEPSYCTVWASGAFQGDFSLLQRVLSFLAAYVHMNGPMWSLRVELAYSLAFPLMYWLIENKQTRHWTIAALVVLALLPIPRVYSLHYALAFALGAATRHYRIRKSDSPARVLALASLMVLFFGRTVIEPWFEEKGAENLEMVMSFVLINLIFHKNVDLGVLRGAVVFYLGEISYSIYLLHLPLVFAMLYGFTQMIQESTIVAYQGTLTFALGAVVFVFTIILSSLNFHAVEMPFQKLGVRTARWLTTRTPRELIGATTPPLA